MKMCLMSGAGVSALIPLGDADATTYWLSRFIEKGVVPEIKIVEESEL